MATEPPLEPVAVSHSVRKQLLAPGKFRFLGRNRDWWIKQFFEGNAALSIVVLLLIVLTLFRDAAGFIPGIAATSRPTAKPDSSTSTSSAARPTNTRR